MKKITPSFLDAVKEQLPPAPVKIDTSIEDLTDRIINETDVDELKNIINIFNLSIQKKNIARTGRLSVIQDLITDQIEERVKKKPDEFNNQDLLAYFRLLQDTITKSDISLNKVDTPSIQVTQNQLNINVQNENILDRDSRERVVDTIRSILNSSSSNGLQQIIESTGDSLDE